MMNRAGVMAPPTLYELPAPPGLMSASSQAPPHEISLRVVLWSIAVVLGVVELFLQTVS
jgi:hypothetical protein